MASTDQKLGILSLLSHIILVVGKATKRELTRIYQIGDLIGEGNCILGFGDIARARSDHEEARAHDEEALALYRKAGQTQNEALCLDRLKSLR